MSCKTLFVACGGSGIKTLIRFNEMMAGNDEWRSRLPKDVAYIIIDTHIDETEEFEAKIKEQMGDVEEDGMPVIKLIKITDNLYDIGKIVDYAFCNHENDASYARLRPFWWFTPDGEKPFRARSVRKIKGGAGQCSPVSFLCTWKYLPSIETELDDILNEIRHRNQNEPMPLKGLQVYFIAGLAGGTGRGSWMPAMFKIRQHLELKPDIEKVNPTGIFFESGCYPNVFKDKPDQALSMKVNTVTGLSELSAWMNLVERERKYSFTLPNLLKPEYNASDPNGQASTDVIKVEPDETDFDRRSPVNSAYLICKDAGHGTLEKNDQYHEMVGSALYMLITGSQIVDATQINMLENFGSLGANTFEVETVPLKTFFEAFIRKVVAEALCKESKRGDELDKNAEEIIASLDQKENSLHDLFSFLMARSVNYNDIEKAVSVLKQTKTKDSLNSTETSPTVNTSAPTETLNIVSRIVSILCAEKKDVAKTFLTKIKENKRSPKDVWSHVNTVFSSGNGNNPNGITRFNIGTDAIDKAIDQTFKEEDLFGKLRKLVETAYTGNGKEASLGRAIATIKKFQTKLQESIEVLDKEISTTSFGNLKESQDVIKAFKSDFDKKAKLNTLGEKLTLLNFTKGEIQTLYEEFAWFYGCATFFKLKPHLKARYQSAIDYLEKLKTACETLQNSLKKIQRKFEKETDSCVKAKHRGDGFKTLFTEPNVESMLADIPEFAEPKNMYKRVLKPIMTEEEVCKLLLTEDSHFIRKDTIKDAIFMQLRLLLALEKAPNSDYLAEIGNSLETLLKKNVFLAKDFMNENFSFDKVLENNIPQWNILIAEKSGNTTEFNGIHRRFLDYLGIDLKNKLDVEGSTPPQIRNIPEHVIERITESMVTTCRPWVELDQEDQINKDEKINENLETIVLLPVGINEKIEKKLKTSIENIHGSRNVLIFHHNSPTTNNCTLPVDRIVSYASQSISSEMGQPLDLVQSISSTWNEPEIKKALEEAENHNATAYFEKDGDDYKEIKRTLGFVSPIYLNEPELSEHRWHPWKDEPKVDNIEEVNSLIDKALLYAFLGVEASKDDAAILETLSNNYKWSLPLIKIGAGTSKTFSFSREPMVWKQGHGEFEANPAWSKDSKLPPLDQLYDFLSGKGKPGLEGSKLDQSKEDGKRMLQSLIYEAEVFDTNIVPLIGVANKEKLCNSRNEWFKKIKGQKPQSKNKSLWNRLQKAAAKQNN